MARKLRVLSQDEGANAATLYIYDVIDPFWGVSAEALAREIDALDVETINVRLNSPGGDVFDGFAIFNALDRSKARVVAHVDGMAASVASIIMLAADEVVMAANSFVMIHNPWMIAIGDVEELTRRIRMLEKLTDEGVKLYARETENSETQIREWMSAETWFDAEEAVEAGFADRIGEESAEPVQARVAARFDFSKFHAMPDRVAALIPQEAGKVIATIRDFEEFLRDEGGFSRSAAKSIASAGFKDPQQKPEPRDEAGDAGDELLSRMLTARLDLQSRHLNNRH